MTITCNYLESLIKNKPCFKSRRLKIIIFQHRDVWKLPTARVVIYSKHIFLPYFSHHRNSLYNPTLQSLTHVTSLQTPNGNIAGGALSRRMLHGRQRAASGLASLCPLCMTADTVCQPHRTEWTIVNDITLCFDLFRVLTTNRESFENERNIGGLLQCKALLGLGLCKWEAVSVPLP